MNWLARLKKAEAAGVASYPTSPMPGALENLRKPKVARAANDPASAEPHGLESAALELPADPDAWRELATAYYEHHFKCVTCIAAGRGANYGPRCGAGAALWRAYDDDAINRHQR